MLGGLSVASVMTWAWRNASADTLAAFAHSEGVWYESIWHKRHTRGALSQLSGHPVSKAGGGMIVLGRTYLMTYTDGRGQAQTERGCVVALDQDGFVVLQVNGKHLLVPKARIDALLEVE